MRLTRRSQESGLIVLRVAAPVRAADLPRLGRSLLELFGSSSEVLVDVRSLDRWDLGLVQTIIAARRSAAEKNVALEILCDEVSVQSVRRAGLASIAGV